MSKFRTTWYEVLRELPNLRVGPFLAVLTMVALAWAAATAGDVAPGGWLTTGATTGVGLLVMFGWVRLLAGDPMDLMIVTAVGLALHPVGPASIAGRLALLAVVVGWAEVVWWAGPQTKLMWLRTDRQTMDMWWDRANAQGGMASEVDKLELVSAHAMRKQFDQIRPGLADLSKRAKDRMAVTEYAYRLLRGGLFDVWMSAQMVLLAVAPPRSGKTEWIKQAAIDAPGARIITTTKSDILAGIGATTACDGTNWVVDPTGGGVRSNVEWSLLDGCEDYTTAQRRADGLLPPKQESQQENWDAKARPILAIMMRAAALSHRPGGSCFTMTDVLRWLASPDVQGSQTAITNALGQRDGHLQQGQEIRIFFGAPAETRGGVISHIQTPLSWVSNPYARRLGDAPLTVTIGGQVVRNPALFDPVQFATSRDTLYVVADKGIGGASLAGALVGEIMHQVKTATKDTVRFPGGRLGTPMSVFVDEADRTCPIDLPALTSEMGSRGVCILIFVQGMAQLETAWGTKGARTIRGNANSTLIFGGLGDAEDASDVAALAGDHLRQLDPDDRRMTATVPVGQVRAMRSGYGLLLRHGMLPALGRHDQFYVRLRERTLLDWVRCRPGAYARNLRRMPGWEMELEPVAPVSIPVQSKPAGVSVESV